MTQTFKALRFKEDQEWPLAWAQVEDWYVEEDPLGDYFMLFPYKAPNLLPESYTLEEAIKRVTHKMSKAHTMLRETVQKMEEEIMAKCELAEVTLTIP
ncbi:hypothetical protein Q5H92_14545 [Hymenobacter sp. M29]|uniref:Uncharacterized protein n=1 Tax=Hymenobacter mellowenesis TaxID=3063995 RepID=A0ABT9ACL0_9BACT|nr:hypothetical protein [Hymenobacter sp. M29]MDO7847586.1 hypothetical protein [Hymenobacter sp. M29]